MKVRPFSLGDVQVSSLLFVFQPQTLSECHVENRFAKHDQNSEARMHRPAEFPPASLLLPLVPFVLFAFQPMRLQPDLVV